ncbi:hypothetical protein RKE29_16430 [Streptomyces sp. B1866]|uniref:hypothetical protein n=1 Tax=Streptomyces sp. B1866 TaxID=3075431 RepID=UPI00288EF4C6|nr:hypothetical protein [Streptomyces sp. B1866]MDT3398210.1 hypothetical protein [Streptomyces sp. B1866]
MRSERDTPAPPPEAPGRTGEPAWAAAWTGGRPAVHLGNVGEFHAQFPGASPTVRGSGDHYACLAAFLSPRPRIVVLPRHVDPAWTRLLERLLDWEGVEVYGGVDGESGLCDAVRARPALRERIAAAGPPLIPWGRTAASDRLAASCRAEHPPGAAGALAAVRRHESKAAAHALFARLAPDHPGVVVPAQWHAASPRHAARLLAARAAAGLTTVVKAEYGAGGSATAVLTPAQARRAGRAYAIPWARRAPGTAPPRGPLLIEDHVAGRGPHRNPTFDGFVAGDGTVHPVGTGLMDVAGTRYRGVTVGPGALPGPLAAIAARFGAAVGRALAADGYRGWYDVDFVTDRAGRLAPVETNLRLTGPAAAFALQARLARLHGGGPPAVRTLDRLPLGARLPARDLLDHLAEVARRCRPLGVTLLPTIPTASYEPDPYAGVALAAPTPGALDAAEAVLRAANRALGRMFRDLDRESGPGGPGGRGLSGPRGAARRRRPPPRPRA